MVPTALAILQALRTLYVLLLISGLFLYLFPGRWWILLSEEYGEGTLLRLGIGGVFFALLVESVRVTLLRKQQAALAKALLRVSPELRRWEAVEILVRALDSDDSRVVENAHRELKRLTQTDHGKDAAAWRRWIKRQKKKEPAPEESP